MFSKTSSAAMAATAFTLSLALVSPAVGATTTTPTANATVAAAQPAKGGDARTLFGTTAPREGGQSLAQAIARQDNAYGRVPALRLFYTGLPASWEHIRSQTGKRRVVVSFKADPVAVANGRFDSELRRWFATAPTDARTWWSSGTSRRTTSRAATSPPRSTGPHGSTSPTSLTLPTTTSFAPP